MVFSSPSRLRAWCVRLFLCRCPLPCSFVVWGCRAQWVDLQATVLSHLLYAPQQLTGSTYTCSSSSSQGPHMSNNEAFSSEKNRFFQKFAWRRGSNSISNAILLFFTGPLTCPGVREVAASVHGSSAYDGNNHCRICVDHFNLRCSSAQRAGIDLEVIPVWLPVWVTSPLSV